MRLLCFTVMTWNTLVVTDRRIRRPEGHLTWSSAARRDRHPGHLFANTHQQVVAVSTDRLHTIAGEYKGKDDPVAIIRSQGIFPAPEELVSPYMVAHFVAGDARGSHHMPLMPVAINTPVAGAYCLPLVACMAYSVTKDGSFRRRGHVWQRRLMRPA
jgi:hypothetical protein